MLYRILRPIQNGDGGEIIERGSIVELDDWPEKKVARLLAAGLIARAAAPPLVEIPGWKTRSQKCAEIGIFTIEEFLSAENSQIAKLMRTKADRVEGWKQELRGWLTAAPTGA